MSEPSIRIRPDGPYLVSGDVPLLRQHIVIDEAGDSIAWQEGEALPVGASYALCRCGQSNNKPFCDGSHRTAGFDGTETASRETYAAQATVRTGPQMSLQDAPPLCASARFCHPGGGVWRLVGQTDLPEARALVEHEAGHCPSGRLVARDAAGAPLEPAHEPSISLVEDTVTGGSGPLWVRGGIPVESADGSTWEVRNRVTLCRCGASANKPFCDGSHVTIGFRER